MSVNAEDLNQPVECYIATRKNSFHFYRSASKDVQIVPSALIKSYACHDAIYVRIM